MVNGKNLFGKRLKAARKKAGLSQRKLGLAAGMDIENAIIKMKQKDEVTFKPKYLIGSPLAHNGFQIFLGRDFLLHGTLFYNGIGGSYTFAINSTEISF